MLRLLILISVPAIVTPFTHPALPLHPTLWSSRKSSPNLHAANRRGGAMARRKISIIRIEDDVGSDDVGVDRRMDDPAPSKSENIYSMPPLYDLAFGYRSYEDEVEFLLHAHSEHSKDSSAPLRLLELAAGPARHSLAALSEHPPSRVDSVVALDLSRAMVDYGLANADHDLGVPGGRRDDFDYVQGDMRNVRDYTKGSFDSVWLLLGSMQHLLTNDDIIACFSSLHSVLKSVGTVVIELPHPRETFKMGECTTNRWTVPLVEDAVDEEGGEEKEYGELSIVWGEEGDVFDPVSQIRHFSIGLELRVNDIDDIPKDEGTSLLFSQMKADGKTNVKEVVPLRLFTLQEIDALARVAGFKLVAKYGALAEDVSIDDEDEAFRMVCVLGKKAEM